MREFSNTLSDDFLNGIKRDERVLRGAPFMDTCVNLVCHVDGLQPFNPIQDPFNGSVKLNFPFPQLFRGKSLTLLADRNKIEVVDTSVVPWQTMPVNLVDSAKQPTSFSVAEPWHFIDFGTVWYLFNRDCVIINDGSDFLNGQPLKAYCFKDIQVSTGEEHNGRIIFGGFQKDKLFSAGWKEILTNIADELQSGDFVGFSDIDQSYIMWSSIGGGDFPLWLFFPKRAIYGNSYRSFDNVGGFSQESFKDTMLYDTIRRNEFGFMKMPFSGEVLHIKRLNTRVIVYGSDGIVGLFPYSSRDSEITTYGMIHLSRIGIPRRSFVGGDDNQHLFIDTEGNLWAVSGEFNLQRLGYKQDIIDLLSGEVAIHKNTHDTRQEFYISGKDRSFTLTNKGLTEHRQQIASYVFLEGGHLGTASKISGSDSSAIIITNQNDLGLRGVKTVTSVNLSMVGGKNVKVAFDFRHTTKEDFKRTPFVPVNKEGNAMIRVTGVDFRLVITSEDFSDFELDYAQVKWQADDRRFIRGATAAPGQARTVENVS